MDGSRRKMKNSMSLKKKRIIETFSSIKISFCSVQSNIIWLQNWYKTFLDDVEGLLLVAQSSLLQIQDRNLLFVERLPKLWKLSSLETRIHNLHRSNYETYRAKLLVLWRKTLRGCGIRNHELIVNFIRRVGMIRMKRFSSEKTYSILYVGQTKFKDNRNVPHGKGCLYQITGPREGRVGSPKVGTETKYLPLIFRGNFENNKREGKGIEYSPTTGIIEFEGLYSRNVRHGRGSLRKGSMLVEGIWKLGRLEMCRKEYHFDYIQSTDEIRKQLIFENIIGEGASAIVYKIMYNQKVYALKMINYDFHTYNIQERLLKNQIIESLRNNIQLMNHECICKIYGIVEDKTRMGFLLEYCSQSSVDKFIMRCNSSIEFREKISLRVLIRFLLQTARGMAYLHEKGIMHRDLKWGNVLISRNGTVKITDFDSSKEDSNLWKNSLNHTRSSIGTPYFLAPEVFTGEYDNKIDVYSFGIMLYCLIFAENNPFDQVEFCKCKVKMKDFQSIHGLLHHVKNCQIRPRPEKKLKNVRLRQGRLFMVDDVGENMYDEKIRFLINLMKHCWNGNNTLRPQFKSIVRILESDWGLGCHEIYCRMKINVFVIRDDEHLVEKIVDSEEEEKEDSEGKKIFNICENREILLLERSIDGLKESIRIAISEEPVILGNEKYWRIESLSRRKLSMEGIDESLVYEHLVTDSDLKRTILLSSSSSNIPEIEVEISISELETLKSVGDNQSSTKRPEPKETKKRKEIMVKNVEVEENMVCGERGKNIVIEKMRTRIEELERLNKGSKLVVKKLEKKIVELEELVRHKEHVIEELLTLVPSSKTKNETLK